MTRSTALTIGGAATALILGATLGMTDRTPGGPGAQTNTIVQEPVLVHEVAGFGLAGPVHVRFTLYNNGLLSYSASSWTSPGEACFTYIDPEAVADLMHDLRQADAYSLGDAPIVGADIPLTTITLFAPPVDGWSRSRTFSYGFALDQYAEVAGLIADFAEVHLPEECDPVSSG